jgi:N-acetylmuramoyl-L-alanine amidase
MWHFRKDDAKNTLRRSGCPRSLPVRSPLAPYASPSGKQLGQDIIDANTVMPSRGARADVRSLAIPKYKNGVGVIVEVGFINSATDRALVNKSAQKIGADIAKGIVKYISEQKGK